MRTTAGLLLIAVGAILAFAVTANTSVLNLHTVGYVLIVIGVIGMFLPARRNWQGRRLVRRTQWRPASPQVRASIPAAPSPGTRVSASGLTEDVYEEED